MIATTTLNKIRSHGPCESGWKKLLLGLGKSGADDEQLTLERILEINGLQDALWALRSVDNIDKPARLFACDCAQRVAHINTDPRLQACIDTSRRFANGEATGGELSAAWAAAWAAARGAARAAALEAAGASAVEAAGASAVEAAGAAAGAARDAAGAARYAAGAARDAAGAARYAAGAAALEAERKIQTELFIKHFCR
jgi:hypothetical protein